MECVFFIVVIAVLAWLRRWERYVHWRGPRTAYREDVQAEHFELFGDPHTDELEEHPHG